MSRDLVHKKVYQKEYYLINKSKLLNYRRQHYLDNKEIYDKRISDWQKNNPDLRKRTILKNVYGITLEDYNLMFEKQEGKCFGCKTSHSELKRGLLIDHNHTTGKVRGLLCDNCNKALGCVKDNISVLTNLITYLNNE